MNILVTGSKGFVGKNLVENLRNIRDGKDKTRSDLNITDVYEYDIHTKKDLLDVYCKECDFVFNFAGINRPQRKEEFMEGNFGFSSLLLDTLKKYQNKCPVMLSSSIQAFLTGRYEDSEYGKSKLAGEELFFEYAQEMEVQVFIYRFPNIFGKWCRPNYNSVIATFCNAIANDEEYIVDNRATELEFLYIDDLINEMLDVLEGKEHRCNYDGIEKISASDGKFCYVPTTYFVTLGEIVDLLESYRKIPETLLIPEVLEDSFSKKLLSTFQSYLPEKDFSYDLTTNVDNRGTFTELVRFASGGQISINVTYPGNVRGQHWHNSKWEMFIVVSGHGLIQERKIGKDEDGKLYPVYSFEVKGEQMKVVQILPGYTHNIVNLSNTENLITVMWVNEVFNSEYPDTYFEKVEK